jgi:hypothetical protein
MRPLEYNLLPVCQESFIFWDVELFTVALEVSISAVLREPTILKDFYLFILLITMSYLTIKKPIKMVKCFFMCLCFFSGLFKVGIQGNPSKKIDVFSIEK